MTQPMHDDKVIFLQTFLSFPLSFLLSNRPQQVLSTTRITITKPEDKYFKYINVNKKQTNVKKKHTKIENKQMKIENERKKKTLRYGLIFRTGSVPPTGRGVDVKRSVRSRAGELK